MLYFSVHTKQMDPYIFHIALNQHRDLNIKMEHGEAFSIFHHGVDTLEVKGNMEGGIGIKGLLTLYSVFDLAGYYADLGLGVEAEFAYHDLENGSLACEDIKVYPYSTNGLDTDSLLGDVLKKYFDFDLEFKPLQNDENNNLRIKMHKENGVRVEKCTYASGGITGYVYSGKTRLPIENARVRISRKVRAGSGNGGNSVAGGGSGGGSHGAWSLETEENEIAVFSRRSWSLERGRNRNRKNSLYRCVWQVQHQKSAGWNL